MRKILVITNGNIGDFVMATSALKLLRQTLPDTNITLITSIKVKEFIENLSLVNSVIYTNFSFSNSIFSQRLYQILWFFRNYFKIKKKKFDDCIFLDHSRFFAKAVPLYKIKNLIGPSTWWCGNKIFNPNAKTLTKVVDLPLNSDKLHMSERYQTIIRNYLGSYNLAKPVLPKTNNQTEKKVALLLSKKKKYSITFSLRGDDIKGNKKIYPINNTIEIIRLLSKEFDIDFYLLGTKIYYEDAKYIKTQLSDLNINNLCKKTSLSDLREVFEQTDLLISVDTGTIHIAATTKTNIIGLYGANLYNSCPISHKAIILYTRESCSPCNYTRTVLGIPCPFDNNPKCLENISYATVVETAKKILSTINLSFRA
jgi:ADP-heptose:LPS heptosyltransferase